MKSHNLARNTKNSIKNLLKKEEVLYFYSEIDKKISRNKEDFCNAFRNRKIEYYNTRHSSFNNMIEETTFKYYNFLFEGNYLFLSSKTISVQQIEKLLEKKAYLVYIKLNNRLYLNNLKKPFNSLFYKKEATHVTRLIKKMVLFTSKLNRNNVN